jgi:serine/threonine protein kinase
VQCRRSEFKEVRLLGEGNFSVVRAAKHRLDGIEYAIKRSTKDITDPATKKQWVQVWH